MSLYIGEFIGTMILIILGNGVLANVILRRSKAEGAGWMVITVGWALAVVFGVYCAIAAGAWYADINPVLTIIRGFMGGYTLLEMIGVIASQILGAFVGACIVWIHFYPHWKETEESELILAVFTTGPAIRNAWTNLISEIIGTAMLVFPFFALTSGKVWSIPAYLLPCIVGFLIWAIGLSLGGTTCYALYPARDFGPRLAHALLPIKGKGASDWSYAWVPIVGPLIGGGVGFLMAKVCF